MTVSKLILSKIKQAVIRICDAAGVPRRALGSSPSLRRALFIRGAKRFLAALGLVLVLAICQNLANL